MKLFVFPASLLLILSGFSASKYADQRAHSNFSRSAVRSDTTHPYLTDGIATDWQTDQFQTGEDSAVFYAVDNDTQNLYAIISVPDFSIQAKLMRNGMKLFIDLKGKKKEGRGIEFPVKGEVNNVTKDYFADDAAAASRNTGDNTQPQTKKKMDKKSVRNILSLGLTALKLFGFSKNDGSEQGLTMENSVRIAFKWDASDVMHIEYRIPLTMLGDSKDIDQKEISVGWRINGFERPAGSGEEAASDNSSSGGHHGGFSRGGGGNGGMSGGAGGHRGGRGFNGAPGRAEREYSMGELTKEQNFWTKYTLHTSAEKKAF